MSVPSVEDTEQWADAVAQEVSSRAGVQVREVSEIEDLRELAALLVAVWRPEPGNPPMTTEILRALAKSGNYVVAAYDAEGMVGACAGFFADPRSLGMHSHIAAVAARGRGRDIGHALKLHQRAWALRRGVHHVSWTYDPLVRRNAYFNVAKLSATPTEYLPDFYGQMADTINEGDASDRLLVSWDLLPAPGHRPVPARAALPATVALARTVQGAPELTASGPFHGTTVAVAVPADIERLRHDDPPQARAWRAALREVLGGLMADGMRVTGFERAGWYVLDRTNDASEDRQTNQEVR